MSFLTKRAIKMVNKVTGLIAFALFVAVATIYKPEFLGTNTFLTGFVNHEILALMAVILTITLASVANIHMSLNALILRRFRNNPEIRKVALDVKTEMNDNAWLIIWGFLITVIVLVTKGCFEASNHLAQSIANGIALWLFLLYFLCLYDIYRVVFGIVQLELEVGNSPDGQGGEQ